MTRLITRRHFGEITAAVAATATLPRFAAASIAQQYAGLESARYLGPLEVIAEVEDREVFTEGPAVDPDGNVLFTNVPVSKILQWHPSTGQLSVFREGTNRTNGLLFDTQGRLLACEGGGGRVIRHNLATGEEEILADRYNGKKLAAPNDLCLDSAGRVFFTSRTAVEDPAGENVKAVYRIDADGTLHQVLAWPEVHMPNGIAVSPDDRTLYLIEAHPAADHHRDIRAFDLQADGSLANGRVIADLYPGRSGDGMCIGPAGNLYVAAGLHKRRGTSETLDTRPGIHVFSPTGELLAYRETPEDTVTNCTIAGESLFATCGRLLLKAALG